MSDAQDKLRKLLSPAIRGHNTDALLEALAVGDDLNQFNVEAIHDQLYLIKASAKYLDRLAGNIGLLRPANVGLGDDAFRNLAILTTSRKQITQILLDVLAVFYGPDSTRAFMQSAASEPFGLADGQQILLKFDNQREYTVTFTIGDFQNIGAATAKEVADAITKQLRSLSSKDEARAYAVEYLDDYTGLKYVQLFSGTKGPLSAVQVLGGNAQNILKFPLYLNTTQTTGTQWSITKLAGATTRFTWTGGPNPGILIVSEDDILNIYGTNFNADNRGSFTIKTVVDGLPGSAYVEIDNPLGVAETVTQLAATDLTFIRPERRTILSTSRYATVYEVAPNVIQVFLVATTDVIERDLVGAAHIHPDALDTGFLGPYTYDTTQPGILTEAETFTSSTIEKGQTYQALAVANAQNFPDEPGYIMLEFGRSRQEGPIRYLGRPGNQLLLLDPTYLFRFSHDPNANVTYLSSRSTITPEEDGTDYAFYLTGTAGGRLYAETLIDQLVATGLTLIITVLYPGDVGLGNAGEPSVGEKVSDKVYIWGGDPS